MPKSGGTSTTSRPFAVADRPPTITSSPRPPASWSAALAFDWFAESHRWRRGSRSRPRGRAEEQHLPQWRQSRDGLRLPRLRRRAGGGRGGRGELGGPSPFGRSLGAARTACSTSLRRRWMCKLRGAALRRWGQRDGPRPRSSGRRAVVGPSRHRRGPVRRSGMVADGGADGDEHGPGVDGRSSPVGALGPSSEPLRRCRPDPACGAHHRTAKRSGADATLAHTGSCRSPPTPMPMPSRSKCATTGWTCWPILERTATTANPAGAATFDRPWPTTPSRWVARTSPPRAVPSSGLATRRAR